MATKYKIEKAKVNKQLVGDEVTVSKIKPKGGRGPKGPKQPTTRQLLVDFIQEVRTQLKAHGWTK